MKRRSQNRGFRLPSAPFGDIRSITINLRPEAPETMAGTVNRPQETDEDLLYWCHRIYISMVEDSLDYIKEKEVVEKVREMLAFYADHFKVESLDRQLPTKELIKEIKNERKRMGEEVAEYYRRKHDPEDKGYATFETYDDAVSEFTAPLALVSRLRATRNLTFSTTGLKESLHTQREYFAKDRSMYGEEAQDPESVRKSIEREFKVFLEGIFEGYLKNEDALFNPTPLIEKPSSCTEKSYAEGGRTAIEQELVDKYVNKELVGEFLEQARRVAGLMRMAGCKDIPLPKGKRICEFSTDVSVDAKSRYGGVWNFQEIKLFACLCEGINIGMIDIQTDDITSPYVKFNDFKNFFGGTRIIEMADKDRTVSIASAISNTFLEFQGSQLRQVMMMAREEFVEGYKGSEDMGELLERFQGKDGNPGAFHWAAKSFIEGTYFTDSNDFSALHTEPISNNLGGPSFGFDTSIPRNELRLIIYITDYTAATEQMSHAFGNHMSKCLMEMCSPTGKFSGSHSLNLFASGISFLCKDFAIAYLKNSEDPEFIVESEDGVGFLMGLGMVKEVLHLSSCFASETGTRELDKSRAILGDDLMLLYLKHFFARSHFTGLVTNYGKAMASFFPQLTDRSMVAVLITGEGGEGGVFRLVPCTDSPPKLYALTKKYQQDKSFISEIPRFNPILMSIVSDDLSTISDWRTYWTIRYATHSMTEFEEILKDSEGVGVPIHYGGVFWASDFEEYQYLLVTCIPQLATLFSICDEGMTITIYSSCRKIDWRKEGLIRINDIYSHLSNSDETVLLTERGREDDEILFIDPTEEYFKKIHPKVRSDRAYPDQVFYVSASNIFNILEARERRKKFKGSHTPLFRRLPFKDCRLAPEDVGSLRYNLDYLQMLDKREVMSGRVPRPFIVGK